MFEFLRKMIGPIMIIVLIAFVCTIIFSWGGGGFQDKPTDTIAVIDGENISFNVFDSYYSRLYRQEQTKTDDDLTPEQVSGIREQAWAQMVSDHLINKIIEQKNIQVTSREMFDYLRMYPPTELQTAPQFTTDGKFDYQKYVNAMVAPENAPFWAQLETFVMPEVKKIKLQEEIVSTVRVTPAEVLEAFLEEKEKVRIGYLWLKSDDIRKVMPELTDAELRAYYDAHREEFKQDEKAVLELVTFDKAPTEDDWARLKYEIDDIYDSAVAGADFAELAQTFSQDNSAASGGDIGWFERGRMAPAFDSAVWALNIGGISQPVRTQFGWHIIKLHDSKTEKNTTGNGPDMIEKRHASHILLKIEAGQATLDQMSQNAEEFADAAREEGFTEAAQKFNYEVKTTAPFAINSYIQHINDRNQAASKMAFNEKPGTISDVMESPAAYFVARVKEKIPAGYSDFETARNLVHYNLAKEKSIQKAADSAKIVYNFLMAGNTFSRAAETFGLQYFQTELINRKSPITGIGLSPEIAGAGFALLNVNMISKPVDFDRGAVIVTLLERQTPDLTAYNQIQDSVYYSTLQKKYQAAYNIWFDNMISSAKIENYVDDFYKGGI